MLRPYGDRLRRGGGLIQTCETAHLSGLSVGVNRVPSQGLPSQGVLCAPAGL